jgi:8-oxo-dGTP diphosphatase
MKFCPQCATPLHSENAAARAILFCPNCQWRYWNNPVPAAGCLIEDSGKILLILRKNPPRAGMWSLPVGFLHHGETLEDCAARETTEETGLRVEPVALIGSYSDVIDEHRSHVVSIYRGRIIAGELRAGDDAEDVRWFSMQYLPELAFPSSQSAITQWLSIRNGPVNAVYFCPRCRGPLEKRFVGLHEYPACPTCHYIHFHNPIPLVAVLVSDLEHRILLVKRKLPPRIGDWALPGGYIDFGETAEEAAQREVREETGLQVKVTRHLFSASFPNPLNVEQYLLKTVFVAEMTGGMLQAGDDAADARFFDTSDLPSNLAHENEWEVIRTWKERNY